MNQLDKESKTITLHPDDISDSLYDDLHDAFSRVLQEHGIDPKRTSWDTWHLTATYTLD